MHPLNCQIHIIQMYSIINCTSYKLCSLLLTEAILEGLANELRRIVEEREAKNMPASQQELDELDLKLRSLRTQLRKAEEATNHLAKQKKELDEKIQKNSKEVRLALQWP